MEKILWRNILLNAIETNYKNDYEIFNKFYTIAKFITDYLPESLIWDDETGYNKFNEFENIDNYKADLLDWVDFYSDNVVQQAIEQMIYDRYYLQAARAVPIAVTSQQKSNNLPKAIDWLQTKKEKLNKQNKNISNKIPKLQKGEYVDDKVKIND